MIFKSTTFVSLSINHYILCLTICLSFTAWFFLEEVMEIVLPQNTLCTSDILDLVDLLKIPNFAGVKMRDELQGKANTVESGIINLNTSSESGSHWTCYFCNRSNIIYFDSFSEPPPIELLKYIKSDVEFSEHLPVIKRNALTVQHDQSSECGSLCLFVLKQLSLGVPFPDIINFLDKRYRRLQTIPLKLTISSKN